MKPLGYWAVMEIEARGLLTVAPLAIRHLRILRSPEGRSKRRPHGACVSGHTTNAYSRDMLARCQLYPLQGIRSGRCRFAEYPGPGQAAARCEVRHGLVAVDSDRIGVVAVTRDRWLARTLGCGTIGETGTCGLKMKRSTGKNSDAGRVPSEIPAPLASIQHARADRLGACDRDRARLVGPKRANPARGVSVR